jgi:hypothetical protein
MNLRKSRRILLGTFSLVFALCLFSAPQATASVVLLDNAPDYKWYYGCSPTAAGMMMGYYDINGYAGLRYSNLVPGGVAELSTYGNPAALANTVIASAGHIRDFYSNGAYNGSTSAQGFGLSGDDLNPLTHSFNSLADFMGTSQDSVGNSNGSTKIYHFTDGSRLTAADAFNLGIWDKDGVFGLYEYFAHAGYSVAATSFFTQPTDNKNASGFTFADYMAEIDAGRVVMIQLAGHSMLGYGYDDGALIDKILFHDTWTEGEHEMTWGGSYGGMSLAAVSCFTPEGGSPVPVPPTVILLGSGLVVIFRISRKRT